MGDPDLQEPAQFAAGLPPGEPAPRPGPPPEESQLGEPDLSVPYNDARKRAISRFELAYVSALLGEHEGNVSRAARAAGLPRKSLSRVMARHGLSAGPDGKGGRPGRPPKE